MPRQKLKRAAAKSQFLIKINGVDFLFSACEGGNLKRETGKYVDPSTRTKVSIVSTKEISNLVLKAPYEPENLSGVMALAQQLLTGATEDTNITSQMIKDDANQTPIGSPRGWKGCQLIEERYPDMDLESTDVAMYELEFTVDAIDEVRAAA
jgi:hypothetical protein